MARELTWREVVARDDVIGGDLETQEEEGVFRGPISEITLLEGEADLYRQSVFITFEWLARMIPGDPLWERAERSHSSFYADQCRLQDIGQGRVFFSTPFMVGTIFPKGGSKLDPERVRGLQLQGG